jgi:capsular polysaccharide transport system ATP-binding protein
MDAWSERGVRFDRVSRIDGRKTQAPRLVLDDVDAYFPADRSTGILSTQPASLTSVIRLITGTVLPQDGAIRRSCSLSFPVAYSQALSRNLTGFQNVRFLARIYGADVGRTEEFVAGFSGLGRILHERASTYKGDNWARFLMAISYAFPFDMYIADGKLVAGSPSFREKCKAHVGKLRESAGMIIATMQPTIVRQFCDRAYVLDGAKLIPFEKIGDAIRYFAPIRAAYVSGHDLGPATDDRPEEDEDTLYDFDV